MKIKNAFTFVELLMVMMILGIIITLTMPLLQNLKNDDDIYRAYMKKALHDVTDATSLVLLRERYLTDFSTDSLKKLYTIYDSGAGKYSGCSDNNNPCANSTGLRAVYNLLAVPGTTCTGGNDCFTDVTSMPDDAAALPGIKIGSKSVMQFEYDFDNSVNPITYGNIYIDVNGNKKPNTPCQDRYKFILYLDRVVMDTTYGGGCNLEL